MKNDLSTRTEDIKDLVVGPAVDVTVRTTGISYKCSSDIQ